MDITDWERNQGNTIQISDFRLGIVDQQDLLYPRTVTIMRGEGIVQVTPARIDLAHGEEFTATFVLAPGFGNPTVSGGEAIIDGTTLRIPSVTSNVTLMLSAVRGLDAPENIRQTTVIYPNPVQKGQHLTIVAPAAGILKITSIDGKLLKQKPINAGTQTIEMNYKPGTYVLIVEAEEKSVYKIVVNN